MLSNNGLLKPPVLMCFCCLLCYHCTEWLRNNAKGNLRSSNLLVDDHSPLSLHSHGHKSSKPPCHNTPWLDGFCHISSWTDRLQPWRHLSSRLYTILALGQPGPSLQLRNINAHNHRRLSLIVHSWTTLHGGSKRDYVGEMYEKEQWSPTNNNSDCYSLMQEHIRTCG